MLSAKRPKEEEGEAPEGDSSSDEEEEEAMAVDQGEVDVDFEGFSLSDQDYGGIRQLLVQLFTQSVDLNISDLADTLIKQNFIGTVLKQGETESESSTDDDVFGLATCYSLTRDKTELNTSLLNYLVAKCKAGRATRENKDKFNKVLLSCKTGNFEKSKNCVGLVFNERFINVPPQAATPMFNKLVDEIVQASKRKHKARYDFNYYVMICKTCTEFSSGKNATNDVLYINAEEELFAQEAESSFDYKVTCSDDDVTKSRRALLLNRDAFLRTVAKLKHEL